MYYKIENKKSSVYRKLKAMRENELAIESRNQSTIAKKIRLKYNDFLGHIGQLNARRVTQYVGFKFTEPEKVNFHVWSRHRVIEGVFVPFKKTKQGQEMLNFLSNELESSFFDYPLRILKIDFNGKFQLPFVEIANELILIHLDNSHIPKSKHVIKISKKKFERLMKKK